MSKPMEEWRPVVGYEDVYSVSSLGRVRREVDGEFRSRAKQGQIRTGLRNAKSGYFSLSLTIPGGKTKNYFLHRVVMASFVGPCPKDREVNHKNGDKSDNRLANLEYVTSSQNKRHARAMGLVESVRGEEHPMAKLSAEKIALARRLRRRFSQDDLAFLFGVSQAALSNALSGRTWAATGRS